VNLKNIPLDDLRGLMGIVTQESHRIRFWGYFRGSAGRG
jgi:hypothetical protein